MNIDKRPLPGQEQGKQEFQHTEYALYVNKSFPNIPDTVCGFFEQDDSPDTDQPECLSEHYGDVFCSVCLNRNNCIKLEAA